MKQIIVIRDKVSNIQCLGVCYVKDENGVVIFKSESIERGWNDNKKSISCIPEGKYPVILEYSNRFKKDLWEIYHVPGGRSECKFHSSNYARQLNGCIALGRNRVDLDSDGYLDVTSSRIVMAEFHKALEGETKVELTVTSV